LWVTENASIEIGLKALLNNDLAELFNALIKVAYFLELLYFGLHGGVVVTTVTSQL